MDEITKKITEIFCGPAPQCYCCGKRNPECTWRPAYQMMLCPDCPKNHSKDDKNA